MLFGSATWEVCQCPCVLQVAQVRLIHYLFRTAGASALTYLYPTPVAFTVTRS